jgi:hypothetical protein
MTRAYFLAATAVAALAMSSLVFTDADARGGGFGGHRVTADRVQRLPGKPLQRAPIVRAPIVVGPAPRSIPGFGLTCRTMQVRVCDTTHCGPNGCPYSCRIESRCIPFRH